LHGAERARDRRRGVEPTTPVGKIAPPPWLDAEQRRLFAKHVKEAPRDIIRPADVLVLAMLVTLESLFVAASRARRESYALVVLDPKHGRAILEANVTLQLRTVATIKPLLDMFGLSPGSRANLTVPEEKPPGDERWKRQFNLQRRVRPGPKDVHERLNARILAGESEEVTEEPVVAADAPRQILRQADIGMLASYVIVESVVADANMTPIWSSCRRHRPPRPRPDKLRRVRRGKGTPVPFGEYTPLAGE
jgi:phage terminase small subunit